MGDNIKGWTETTVGDFTPFLYGKGLSERQRNQAGTVPVYGSNGIVGTHNEALVNNAGVIIGRKGTVGVVHFCKGPFWPIDTAFYVESKPEREIRYIYYLLCSLGLEYMNADSAVPGLNRNAAHARKILVPPLPEQKAIASILGALDDKIELNRKMNETLEAMARAIFKSWFVDFDPIPLSACNAQAGGLGPHKEWQDSTIGKIPKGWGVGTLGDLVDFVNERVEAKPEKDNEKYIALDDMPHRSINLSQFRSGLEVNSSIIRFKEGDILFGAMRPYFHKVGLAQFDGITRTTTFVLRPKQPHMCLFALMNFFSDSVIEYATNASVGSTIPYIKWDALVSDQILMPTEDLIAEYNNFTMPMIHQIKINSKQSLTLASIRDALLPKLLSGEIRVKDN